MPCTNVKAKKAFNPIPGAKAKGNFAQIAITNVAKNAAKAVAVNTAPRSIDAAERISGFTARIYDIVKKVVTPAMISVFTFITLGSNPKSFFNIIFIKDKTKSSCTTYSFPSTDIFPASLHFASDPKAIKSSYLITSARINPFSKSV